MKKLWVVFCFVTLQSNAMGIAGKSGDELLYLYIIFIAFALSLIGLDHLYKYAKNKYIHWKLNRHLPHADELN